MMIRKATEGDINQITEIYNEQVINSISTLDIETRDESAAIKWYREHDNNYPILVVEEDNEVIGWLSLSPWSNKRGYDITVEISIYIHKNHRNKGVGNILFCKGIETAKELNYHTILSRIAGDNESSRIIHEKYGFESIGVMKEVGMKFDKYIDVYMYQLILHK